MPKTIIGGIMFAIGWLGQSGIFATEGAATFHAISECLVAIGTLIAAIGVWHGNAKIQAKLAQQTPPATVGEALKMRTQGTIQ